MSDRLKEKEERLKQIIAKLVKESAEGKPIVVEGKKDAQTLRELGLSGRIVMIKTGGKSIVQATEEIEQLSAHEIILLLDFDQRGKEGTMLLKHNLERAKVKVNTGYWKELFSLVGREIQCIESLTAYSYTLRQKAA